MALTYLLLGSNSGDRMKFLAEALRLIDGPSHVRRQSSIYETAPWGNTNQPPFLNQVLEVDTPMAPAELLSELLSVELYLGRERKEKWAERTIDIDILFYENQAVATPDLSIPHPMIQARRFTLVPLCEIVPDLVHPVLNKTMKRLLEECPDKLEVKLVRERA